MISVLKGQVVDSEDDSLTIMAGNVGYKIFCPGYLIYEAAQMQEDITVFVETHVREDHIHLYGFKDKSERKWFNILQTVKGVGARLALVIIDSLSPMKLVQTLLAQDKAVFKTISGVGPKLAERIILELKNNDALKNEIYVSMPQMESGLPSKLELINDAVSALGNLGYTRASSYNIVTKMITENESILLSDIIKRALKELSK